MANDEEYTLTVTDSPKLVIENMTSGSNTFSGITTVTSGHLQVSPYSSTTTTVGSTGITLGGSLYSAPGTLNVSYGTEIGKEFLEAIIASCEKHPELAQRFYDALVAGPVHGS